MSNVKPGLQVSAHNLHTAGAGGKASVYGYPQLKQTNKMSEKTFTNPLNFSSRSVHRPRMDSETIRTLYETEIKKKHVILVKITKMIWNHSGLVKDIGPAGALSCVVLVRCLPSLVSVLPPARQENFIAWCTILYISKCFS